MPSWSGQEPTTSAREQPAPAVARARELLLQLFRQRPPAPAEPGATERGPDEARRDA